MADLGTRPAQRAGTRLGALDAFRGLTVASMILTSSLGSQTDAPYQLTHVPWHGATFRDLIAPWFLFAMGLAMAFALARYVDGRDPTSPWPKVFRRGAILFAVGLVARAARVDGPARGEERGEARDERERRCRGRAGAPG